MNRRPFVRPAIGTGLLLIIPLVMTILDRHRPEGDGWHWGPLDFVVMGGLLFGAGLACELMVARVGARLHRALLGLAILCVVFAIWVELAVGGVGKLLIWLTR